MTPKKKLPTSKKGGDSARVPAERRPVGRPSEYNVEIAAKICAQLSEGMTLRKVCMADDMPSRVTVFSWIEKHPEFLNQYIRAREYQVEYWLDETIDISDESSSDLMADEYGNLKTDHEVVKRSQIRIQARQWSIVKMAPKKYGDKVQQEVTGKDGEALVQPVINLSIEKK